MASGNDAGLATSFSQVPGACPQLPHLSDLPCHREPLGASASPELRELERFAAGFLSCRSRERAAEATIPAAATDAARSTVRATEDRRRPRRRAEGAAGPGQRGRNNGQEGVGGGGSLAPWTRARGAGAYTPLVPGPRRRGSNLRPAVSLDNRHVAARLADRKTQAMPVIHTRYYSVRGPGNRVTCNSHRRATRTMARWPLPGSVVRSQPAWRIADGR